MESYNLYIIAGIANIVGCVSVILTSSLKFNRFLLYFCAITFFAAATIATAFTNSKVGHFCNIIHLMFSSVYDESNTAL